MIDFSNYKYWLVYPKGSDTNICEVFAESAEDAIKECLESYNYDGTYTHDNVYAVCKFSKSLTDIFRLF